MSRRRGTLLSFGSLLFVFMLGTLFFYLVYNMHFDSESDDFSGLIVLGTSYENEPGMQTAQELGTLREDMETWASKNQAILFYKAFSAAGIAAVDYTGWFDKTWDVSFTGQTQKTVLVQKTRANIDSYIEDDTLFPGVYNYRIVGEFEDKNLPTFQGNAFFYYPLGDITNLEGLLYTNVVDQKALADLGQIIKKTGRSMEFQTYNDENLSFLNVIVKMFFGDFLSRSMLFTFLGLIFCAVFSIYMMYRESNRYLAIHHLYGATYLSLFLRLLFYLLGIALIGTFLGYVLGITQLNLLHRTAYVEIAVRSGIYNVMFVSLAHVLCFVGWKRKNHGKVGAY